MRLSSKTTEQRESERANVADALERAAVALALRRWAEALRWCEISRLRRSPDRAA
jgi:hypothetical protein